MSRWSIGLAGAVALAAPVSVIAKPIAFADGYTVMAEYGAGTMKEAQLFYAPRYDFSVGGGHVELDSDEATKTRRINYARLNYLVHRWNLDDAQANVFAWGGLGSATGNTFFGARAALRLRARELRVGQRICSYCQPWHVSVGGDRRTIDDRLARPKYFVTQSGGRVPDRAQRTTRRPFS